MKKMNLEDLDVDSGVSIIEYAFLATLISGIVIFALPALGTNANDIFSSVNNALVTDTSEKPGEGGGDPGEEDSAIYAVVYERAGETVPIEYSESLTRPEQAYELVFQKGKESLTGQKVVAAYDNWTKPVPDRYYAPWTTYRQHIVSVKFETTTVAGTSTAYWFYDFVNCKSMNFNGFDTSNVENMAVMFERCSSLTSLVGLNTFNTSKVINFGGIFQECSSLTSLDLSSFDTSKASNMDGMFREMSSMTSFDVDHFNLSSCIDISRMFSKCSSLTDVSAIEKWNVSSVMFTFNMFYECPNIKKIDLSSWIMLSNASSFGMFYGCSSLTDFQWGKSYKTNSGLNQMFQGCTSLTTIDLSNMEFKTSANASYMFDNCPALINVILPPSIDEFVAWATVQDFKKDQGYWCMFQGCTGLSSSGKIPTWYVGEGATI